MFVWVDLAGWLGIGQVLAGRQGRCYVRSQFEGKDYVYSVRVTEGYTKECCCGKGANLNSAITVNEGKVVSCGFVAILPRQQGRV